MKIEKFTRGFTLPELLLASAIVAFALCGVLATYMACFELMTTSKNTSIATSAAQGLIEQIRSTPFPQIFDTYNNLNFSVNAISSSRGVVVVNDTNPELLRVTITVCWQQGRRIVGEDADLNGILGSGEDDNNNGIIDSPVQLVTLVANR